LCIGPARLPETDMTNGGYLVFETGGTKLVAAVAGADCRILDTTILYRDPEDRAPKSFQRLVEAGRKLKTAHERQQAALKAVGFGFGGIVRRSTRDPFLCLHEQGWEEVRVVETLEREFGVPVAVENDCKLAALAEAHFGAGQGYRTVFYMTIGTGVGGGIVRDGRIQAMSDVGEAEIGHIVVLPDGPPCWCGGRGCVESVCSGPGISQLADFLAGHGPALWKTSSLSGKHPQPGRATSKEIFEAWQARDKFASAVVEAAAGHLATAIAAAVNLLAPDIFVVGGGVGAGNERFLELAARTARPRVVHYFRETFRMVPSALKEQVVTQGAAILASQQLGCPQG
jgi:glucokinase